MIALHGPLICVLGRFNECVNSTRYYRTHVHWVQIWHLFYNALVHGEFIQEYHVNMLMLYEPLNPSKRETAYCYSRAFNKRTGYRFTKALTQNVTQSFSYLITFKPLSMSKK